MFFYAFEDSSSSSSWCWKIERVRSRNSAHFALLCVPGGVMQQNDRQLWFTYLHSPFLFLFRFEGIIVPY